MIAVKAFDALQVEKLADELHIDAIVVAELGFLWGFAQCHTKTEKCRRRASDPLDTIYNQIHPAIVMIGDEYCSRKGLQQLLLRRISAMVPVMYRYPHC